jgi:hypothetical protein
MPVRKKEASIRGMGQAMMTPFIQGSRVERHESDLQNTPDRTESIYSLSGLRPVCISETGNKSLQLGKTNRASGDVALGRGALTTKLLWKRRLHMPCFEMRLWWSGGNVGGDNADKDTAAATPLPWMAGRTRKRNIRAEYGINKRGLRRPSQTGRPTDPGLADITGAFHRQLQGLSS